MNQFVIPKVYREVVLQGILRNTGPPGKNKTLWSARQRYFWPGMDRMISKKIALDVQGAKPQQSLSQS